MAEFDMIGVGFKDPLPLDPPDLIEGLLPSYGQCLFSGETNIGKSLLAIEICSALSTGEPLWGLLEPYKQLTNIRFVLGEHSAGVLQRLYHKTGLPMHDKVRLIGPEHLGVNKQLVVNGLPQKPTIEKLMRWCEGAEFIVFDPLTAFITGAAETENASVPMRAVLDTMALIASHSGAASLILHHLGKPWMDKEGGEHHRKSYASRGSSGIEDAATNIFYFLRAEGAAETFWLNKRKYKGDAPDRYVLQRDPETLRHTLGTGPRPVVDARRREFRRRVSMAQLLHPDLTHTKLIEVMAAAEDLSRNTAFNYMKESE